MNPSRGPVGRFFLGRVKKIGVKSQDALMDAIVHGQSIELGKFHWAITDIDDQRKSSTLPFVFGRLSKSRVEGVITVLDTEARQREESRIPDLLTASSPFVYLPRYSGIAFLRVWNEIQEDVFAKRFCRILESALGDYFVDCSIEPIADYRRFRARIARLERIDEIDVSVHPPNPLYGRLWAPLKQYLARRMLDEVRVRESSASGEGIASDVGALIEQVLAKPDSPNIDPPDIGDAAILMAADGYGYGKVKGIDSGEKVTVRTDDAQVSFTHFKEPVPSELAAEAAGKFERVSIERGLGH